MIYFGNFLHVTNQEEENEENRRHGNFNLIVEAIDYNGAIEKFKTQIIKLRGNTDFFEGKCSIFFTHLFEFDQMPQKEAMMINYKSIAGDPVMPFIGCSVPTDKNDACKIYDWRENVPEIEGKDAKVFVKFNG
ncbi:MAG: hypothetical protein R6U27_04320 [Desulfobacterales bacterium]